MISFTNVSFSFGHTPILSDISFQVKPGEFVFLVGQTGCGKSTLLRLIYMEIAPQRGSVVVGKYNSATITQREKLTEIVELPRSVHPWFLGVQFHPEFKSTPWGGHPLFISFIQAALKHQAERAERVAA